MVEGDGRENAASEVADDRGEDGKGGGIFIPLSCTAKCPNFCASAMARI